MQKRLSPSLRAHCFIKQVLKDRDARGPVEAGCHFAPQAAGSKSTALPATAAKPAPKSRKAVDKPGLAAAHPWKTRWIRQVLATTGPVTKPVRLAKMIRLLLSGEAFVEALP